jgi:ribosome recycling factor
METLKFDRQKAKFLKDETENYYQQLQTVVNCSFQRIRQMLNDKEKAI